MECHACGEQFPGNSEVCPTCEADREAGGGSTGGRSERGGDQCVGTKTANAGGPARSDGGVSAGGPTRTDGGSGGTPADPAGGTDGQGAGGGGGGIQATVSELPLLTGFFAGLLAGIAVILVGVGVALAAPPGRFFGSIMDVATISVVDLHFGFGQHLVPRFVLERFQEFGPPSSIVGLLYLLPPLFLYTVGKAVSSWAPDADSAPEALLNGTTVVLGYLPVMLVLLLLLPGGAIQVRIATPLLLAGIVYPLLFGSAGGLAEHHYPADARRVGVGYGVLLILAVAFLMFLTTFVIAGSLTIADRLVLTTLLLGAVQTQSGVGTLIGAPVLVVLTAVAALAIGFLRTWRAERQRPILEGITRPLTAAWTYALGIAVVVTAIPVFADSYAAAELKLGGLVSDTSREFAAANLATVGDFVDLVFVGTVVFAVVLGGVGGVVAAAIQYRRGARAEQAAAVGGGPAGGEPSESTAGGSAIGPDTGGGATGPAAGSGATGTQAGADRTGSTGDDEPLGPSAGGGRTGPEPGTDSAESAEPGEGSPGVAAGDEVPADTASEGAAGEDSPADEPSGGGGSSGTESADDPGSSDTDSGDTDSGDTDSSGTDSGDTDSSVTDNSDTDSGDQDSAEVDRSEAGFDWGDDDTTDEGEDEEDETETEWD